MISSAALIAAMVLAGPDQNDTNQTAAFAAAATRANRGVIVVHKEIQVPAEVAGKLKSVDVREGSVLKSGSKVAQIIDVEVRARQRIALGELEVAKSKERAAPLRHQEAQYTFDVADSEHQSSLSMNKHEPNTISGYEIRRQKLTRDRAEVQMKTASEEMKQAVATSKTKQAQLDAINQEVKRYQISSPADGGIVVEVIKKAGEWVRQGEPVVRVVQLKQVKVETFVHLGKYTPEDIDGRQIEFSVGKRRFSGKVTFINPNIESRGEYRISAVIDNVKSAKGHWLLRPGMNVTISVR